MVTGLGAMGGIQTSVGAGGQQWPGSPATGSSLCCAQHPSSPSLDLHSSFLLTSHFSPFPYSLETLAVASCDRDCWANEILGDIFFFPLNNVLIPMEIKVD